MSSVDFEPSVEQAAKVQHFRREVDGGDAIAVHVILCFLVARDWDVVAAVAQYTAAQKWRVEQNLNGLHRQVRGAYGDAVHSWLQSGPDSLLATGAVELWPQLRLMELRDDEGPWIYFGAPALGAGHDKAGRPIHLQRAGLASKRFAEACKFIGKGWQQAFLDGHIRQQELQAARMEEATKRLGRLVTQQVVIMDMAHMSFRPDMRAITSFRDLAGLLSNYYPESLHKLFIINAPAVFAGVWHMIRGWLEPRVAGKVHIIGRDFAATLLQHVDAEELPVEYGGSCSHFPQVDSIEEGRALFTKTLEQFNQPALLSTMGWAAQKPGQPAATITIDAADGASDTAADGAAAIVAIAECVTADGAGAADPAGDAKAVV